MNKKKNNSIRRKVSSSVLFGFLAILLCAPNMKADETVPSGETWDISNDVQGALEIYGTANLYDGAYAPEFIYAFPGAAADAPGSIVNIYGCAPGNMLWVLEPTSMWPGLPPEVTAYGSKFQIGSGVPFTPPADENINDTLYALDESDQVLFSIWISTEGLIHLRAPGSSEEERIEAELCIAPKRMHRHRSRPVVFATMKLPNDIKKEDVDRNCQLTLHVDNSEVGTKAKYQRMYKPCRRNSKVKIFAFFNLDSLINNLPDNCEEMQIQVCGKLKSGTEFYGNNTIKILRPPGKRWKHWRWRTSNCRFR